MTYDSRDSNYYPQSGQYARVSWLNFGSRWGGDFELDKIDAFYNHYLPLDPSSLVAFRVRIQDSSDGTPFFALPTLDMRGFSADRYRANDTLSITAEWRHKFTSRWGAVAYAEAGRFAPTLRLGRWRRRCLSQPRCVKPVPHRRGWRIRPRQRDWRRWFSDWWRLRRVGRRYRWRTRWGDRLWTLGSHRTSLASTAFPVKTNAARCAGPTPHCVERLYLAIISTMSARSSTTGIARADPISISRMSGNPVSFIARYSLACLLR